MQIRPRPCGTWTVFSLITQLLSQELCQLLQRSLLEQITPVTSSTFDLILPFFDSSKQSAEASTRMGDWFCVLAYHANSLKISLFIPSDWLLLLEKGGPLNYTQPQPQSQPLTCSLFPEPPPLPSPLSPAPFSFALPLLRSSLYSALLCSLPSCSPLLISYSMAGGILDVWVGLYVIVCPIASHTFRVPWGSYNCNVVVCIVQWAVYSVSLCAVECWVTITMGVGVSQLGFHFTLLSHASFPWPTPNLVCPSLSPYPLSCVRFGLQAGVCQVKRCKTL